MRTRPASAVARAAARRGNAHHARAPTGPLGSPPARSPRSLLAAFAAIPLAGCGSDDGPHSFLARDDTSALFVEWKRVGDDVSGSLSAAEVNQPQTGPLSGRRAAAGRDHRADRAFTGTVSDDSVRLQIGSGAASNRVNGRLDGDTLELTIPQDRAPRPCAQARRQGRLHEGRPGHPRPRGSAAKPTRRPRRRASNARTGKTITRVATAFQKALDPRSPDDPCRYLTPELRDDIVSTANATAPNPDVADIPCKQAIRDSERERENPLYTGPQGVASIRFLSSLIALRGIGQAGPPGAVVTWRPASGRGVLSQSETSFTEQDGKWLVYRCCQ